MVTTIALITLSITAPRYIADQGKAFETHYSEGGYIWKRKDGQSEAYKQFALGLIPASRLDIYDLFMVNGRKPEESDILEAKNEVLASSDFAIDMMNA